MSTFKATLTLRKEPSGSTVYCKVDGERFKKQKTLKFQTEANYRLDISFKPPQTLMSATFHSLGVEFSEKSRDSSTSAYAIFFNANSLSKSKKGQREEVAFVLKLEDSGEMGFVWQVKCYPTTSTQHCDWGNPLHCIEYECSKNQESIAIAKETYR